MHAAVLRYLAAVAESRSIREASERLHISPSALTRQLQKIEESLGARLFDRDSSGIRLTEAGALAVQHAKDTLRDFGRLQGDIRHLSGVVGGPVTIATLNSLTVRFWPGVIADVAARHAEITFRVIAGDPMEVTQQVAVCSADFGITFNAVESKGIRVLRDMPCPFAAVMRPDHPLASHSEVTLEQCSGHRLLYQDNSGPLRLFLGDDMEAFQHLHAPVVTSNSLTLLKNLLLRGMGIAFYTRLGFADEISDGRLTAVPLVGDRAASIRLNLITSPRALPTAATRTVSRAIEDALGRLAAQYCGN